VKAASYSRAPSAKFIERLKAPRRCDYRRSAHEARGEGGEARRHERSFAMGGEGGGHDGSVRPRCSFRKCSTRSTCSVAAAGGFHDGRGSRRGARVGDPTAIAMARSFLLTAESPVPRTTLERYFKAGVDDVFVTTQIDGLPIASSGELVAKLEHARAARLTRHG
jgi:NAD(P)H-dependent flavin oxidoreductase YrpB (nitropropane dioxygenase family)